MNARNSQLYSLMRQHKDKDIAEMRRIFQHSSLYKDFQQLENFNIQNFCDKFDKDDLLNLINKFNIEMKYKEIKKYQVYTYLSKWKDYFTKQYHKYYKKIDKIIYDAKNDDIVNESIFNRNDFNDRILNILNSFNWFELKNINNL